MEILKIILDIIACASGLLGIICFFTPNNKEMGFAAIIIAVLLVLSRYFLKNHNADKKNMQTTVYKKIGIVAFFVIILLILSISLFKSDNTDNDYVPPVSSSDGGFPIYGLTFADAKKIDIKDEFGTSIDVEENKQTEHWYFFEVSEDMNLSLSISSESGMYINIYLYDKNGETQLSHDGGKDKIINLQHPIQSGKFYLKITSDISGLYSVKPSKNISSYTTDESSSSNNNTYQKSLKMTLGEPQYGHLGYYNDCGEIDDTDYFKFVTEKPIILNISLISDDTLHSKISLVAANGDEMIAYDSGKNKKLSIVRALQAGTYYIRISRLNDYGGYVLSTQVTNPKYGSDEEKNNSFQYAKNLSLNTSIYGQIGYIDSDNIHDSEDWYLIQLNSSTVSISLTPIDNKGNIRVALIDNTANNTLASTYCSESISSLKEEKLEPGLYYLKVSTSGDDYGCYSLEIN